MRWQAALSALAFSGSAFAFQGTSPFFLLSTSKLPSASPFLGASDHLATAENVQNHVSSVLESCPSDVYIIVTQPGASGAHYRDADNVPHLHRRLSGGDSRMRTTRAVNSVVGQVGAASLKSSLVARCRAELVALNSFHLPTKHAGPPRVITIDLGALPSSSSRERTSVQKKHDSYLEAVISSLGQQEYTLLYQTSPPSEALEASPHTEIDVSEDESLVYRLDEPYPPSVPPEVFKRNMVAYPRAANGSMLNPGAPLFEKYQFLSPGIFMTLLVALLLLSLLTIGLRALSGLEVSYMAFSKEMAPAQQTAKKQ